MADWMKADAVRQAVRVNYAGVAKRDRQSGCCSASSCCGTAPVDAQSISRQVGYSDAEVTGVPEGANMGLGCGNP